MSSRNVQLGLLSGIVVIGSGLLLSKFKTAQPLKSKDTKHSTDQKLHIKMNIPSTKTTSTSTPPPPPKPPVTTPLHQAAEQGNVPAILSILEKDKSSINLLNAECFTPLHLAAASAQHAAVTALLDNGAAADVDIPGPGGNTALHMAALTSDFRTVRAVLKGKADPFALNMMHQFAGDLVPRRGLAAIRTRSLLAVKTAHHYPKVIIE